MSKERFTSRVAVSLLLIKDDQVLMLRRYNTGWEDGKYSLVGGHVDENETIIETMIREAMEEIGIIIKHNDLQVVHTMHTSTQSSYIDIFLVATKWKNRPQIKERNKADDLKWFPLKQLPSNIPFPIQKGIEAYLNKETWAGTH